jgi:hypothetical protein
MVAAPLVVAGLLAAGPAAAGGPPVAASGTFVQNTFSTSNTRTEGAVTMFDFTERDTLAGTFTGTSLIQGTCVVQTSGQSVCTALETFTGQVGSASGTLQFRDVVVVEATGAVRGSFTIISGTGALAAMRGHGTFEGTPGSPGTYSARLLQDP